MLALKCKPNANKVQTHIPHHTFLYFFTKSAAASPESHVHVRPIIQLRFQRFLRGSNSYS
jgi:hypothetical protein